MTVELSFEIRKTGKCRGGIGSVFDSILGKLSNTGDTSETASTCANSEPAIKHDTGRLANKINNLDL